MRDKQGRQTRLAERRFVHMRDKHLAGQHVAITAENWSGHLTVRAMLDGGIANDGVPRYQQFSGKHCHVRQATAMGPEKMLLEAETTHSRLGIAYVGRLAARLEGVDLRRDWASLVESTRVGREIGIDLTGGAILEVEKIVALYTSSDHAIGDRVTAAHEAIARAGSFDELLQSHALAWEHLWRRCDVQMLEIVDDERRDAHLAVRLHIFHLLQTASLHTIDLDTAFHLAGGTGRHTAATSFGMNSSSSPS